MSFPFDGGVKNVLGRFAASRAMRRAAKRRERQLQKRHAGYKFEALEPRILLAADPFTISLSAGVSTVEIEHTSETTTQIRVTLEGGSQSIIDGSNDGLLLQGTASQDTITVVWVSSEHERADFSVSIDAGDEDDVVTLSSSPAGEGWKVHALTVLAEDISLASATRVEALDNIRFEAHTSASESLAKSSRIDLQGDLVSTLGDIVLSAFTSWEFSGAAPTTAFVQSAAIYVFGEISAFARNVDISAVAHAILSFSETSQLVVPSGSIQNAAVIVHGDASLSGDQVSLLSEADFDLIAQTTPATANSTITIDIEQTALTELGSGANVTARSAAADAVNIDAHVATGLEVAVLPGVLSVSELFGLDAFSANVNLVRHADVIVGGSVVANEVDLSLEDYTDTTRWSPVSLPAETYLSSDATQELAVGDVVRVAISHGQGGTIGQTYVFLGGAAPTRIDAAGGAAFNARLSDHLSRPASKGVHIDIQSNLFGLGSLVLDDRAAVSGQNAQIFVDSLTATARAENSHYVDAQFAQISAVGTVSSELRGILFGAPSSNLQPDLLRLEAVDAGQFRTNSKGFEPDGSINIIDIEAFGAMNSLARFVSADLIGGTVDAAQIEVTANASQVVEAFVGAQSAVNVPEVFNTGTWAFGASYAVNHITGGVSASLQNIRVVSEGLSSSTSVTALNSMQLNVSVEAGSKALGGSGVSAGGVIALNLVGGATAPTARVIADHSGDDTSADLQTDDIVEKDGVLYRFLGDAETSVDLTAEDFANVERWARIYRRSVEDFLLLGQAQKQTLHCSGLPRFDGVVPFGMERIAGYVEASHIGI